MPSSYYHHEHHHQYSILLDEMELSPMQVHSQSNYFIVLRKVDQRAGQLSQSAA